MSELGPAPLQIQYERRRRDAVAPTRAAPGDAGWDLTLVAVDKAVRPGVVRFETGVAVAPPPGYHFEMAPRSSLHKEGVGLANHLGVLDETYRGTIKVVLYTLDGSRDLYLKLPCRAVQLLLRKTHDCEFAEVSELPASDRGEGGFGSTGGYAE